MVLTHCTMPEATPPDNLARNSRNPDTLGRMLRRTAVGGGVVLVRKIAETKIKTICTITVAIISTMKIPMK